MKTRKEYIIQKLLSIKDTILTVEKEYEPLLNQLHKNNQINGKNLLYYLALRTIEIRELQDEMHILGLSSLSNAESHILGQINAVLNLLGWPNDSSMDLCSYEFAKDSTNNKISGLLGNLNLSNNYHIMVTIDGLWQTKNKIFHSLLMSGMTVARINCAHDDEKIWKTLIKKIRKASKETNIPCKICMDLAGPKIRIKLPDAKPISIKVGTKIILTTPEFLVKYKKKKAVACTSAEIIPQLQLNERVFINDGIIKTIIIEKNDDHVLLEVKSIASKKSVIEDEKGINIPNTKLNFPALTPIDEECIPFISKYADIVGYSFVKNKSDIQMLRNAFAALPMPPVILKIETAEAVNNLPSLLFEGMKEEFFGVMIARGDLAIEIGFEKLGEIQEEILWICEAAHVPVVWATQVLENLNKKGLATRSEITDVSHASGADCVMINKGTNILKVIETLKNIFGRMGSHHHKKRFVFRPLSIAVNFFNRN
jgi:pyruvate kinase